VCSLLLSDFCSKDEAWQPLGRQVVPVRAEALPLIPPPLAKRKEVGC
jgi:hypothetical protein